MKSYTFDTLPARLLGRAVCDNRILKTEMTASGFIFTAELQGEALLDLELFGEEPGLLGVEIDGNFDGMVALQVPVGRQTLPIAHLKGVHTIRVVKLNEYVRNRLWFYGLTIDGQALQPPAPKERRLDFFGDSLTCGYGNLSINRNYPDPFCLQEHGYRTYAAFLAQRLNAEFSVAAASGFGLCYSFSGNTADIADSFWNLALPSEKKLWDFSKFVAQDVFINLGTNDMNFAQNNRHPISFDMLYAAADKLISGIRANNPDCRIFIVAGFNGSLQNEYMNLNAVYAEIVKAYSDVWFWGNIVTSQSGGDWHPNVADHQHAAEQIYNRLTQAGLY